MAEALRGKSYAVDFAGTVREAKGCLASQAYDLVIADWKLPDGDGRLIADWATELGAKTVVMSGYLSHMPGGRASDHETLMKPIRLPEFVDLSGQAFDWLIAESLRELAHPREIEPT